MTQAEIEKLYDFYEKSGWWEQKTHTDMLCMQAEKNGDKTALIDRQRSVTFKELLCESNRLSAYFLSEGIKKGDRVVLQHVNTISFVTICFALFRIGAIPTLAMPSHREAEVCGILETSKAKGYIAVRSYHGFNYEALTKKMREKYDFLEHVWFADEIESIVLNTCNSDDAAFEKSSYRDIAILVLSGGSTGIPKLIPRVHASFLHEQKSCADAFGVDESSTVLAAMPLTHAWNLCGPGVFGSLFCGATVVLSYHGSADEILRLIDRYKVTHVALVPSLVMAGIQILNIDPNIDVSSLKSVQIGGSMSTKQLMEDAFKAFGCTIQQAYGMSEGLVCATKPDDDIETLLTTHGKPVSSGDTVVILDEDDKPLPLGEVGEIAARGPSVIVEYYNNEAATNKAFTVDGFYKTGDKGQIIAQTKRVRVLGRTQEQINRLGEKIMPSELEDYLSGCDFLKEAYVIPADDEALIQRICVVAKPSKENVTLNDVREYLEEKQVAAFKMPDQLIIVDKFPYTTVGKVDKKALKRLAEEIKAN